MFNEGNPETKKLNKKLMVKIGRKYGQLDQKTPIRSVTALGRAILNNNLPFARKLLTAEENSLMEEKIKVINKRKLRNLFAAMGKVGKKNHFAGPSDNPVHVGRFINSFDTDSVKRYIKAAKPRKPSLFDLSMNNRFATEETDSESINDKKKLGIPFIGPAKRKLSPKAKVYLKTAFQDSNDNILSEYTGLFYNKKKVRYKRQIPRSYGSIYKNVKNRNMLGFSSKYNRIDNLVKRRYKKY